MSCSKSNTTVKVNPTYSPVSVGSYLHNCDCPWLGLLTTWYLAIGPVSGNQLGTRGGEDESKIALARNRERDQRLALTQSPELSITGKRDAPSPSCIDDRLRILK